MSLISRLEIDTPVILVADTARETDMCIEDPKNNMIICQLLGTAFTGVSLLSFRLHESRLTEAKNSLMECDNNHGIDRYLKPDVLRSHTCFLCSEVEGGQAGKDDGRARARSV